MNEGCVSFSTLITGDNFLNVLEVKWHEMEFELASLILPLTSGIS